MSPSQQTESLNSGNTESIRHSIFVLLIPGFVLLDATGPIQVFATTNDQCRDEGMPNTYDIRAVSQSGGLVSSSSGVRLDSEPLPSWDDLQGSTLLVPGTQCLSNLDAIQELGVWLNTAHQVTRRTSSVCTGAFLLATAGLLDGLRATTHWMDTKELQRRFPRIKVEEDAIYVRDGRIWTSAGISAGIDLALALVEEDMGRTLAMRVAHRLVVYLKRPGGQRQYSAELYAQIEENSFSGRLSAWLIQRLDSAVSVEEMAEAMAVSARTLHRQLAKESGLTPAAWLRRLRVEAACRLLAHPSLSIKQISQRCGFGDEYNMRRAFNIDMRVTPSEYRARIV
jgi:transcriptional regulator GlxA family with amidase domain